MAPDVGIHSKIQHDPNFLTTCRHWTLGAGEQPFWWKILKTAFFQSLSPGSHKVVSIFMLFFTDFMQEPDNVPLRVDTSCRSVSTQEIPNLCYHWIIETFNETFQCIEDYCHQTGFGAQMIYWPNRASRLRSNNLPAQWPSTPPALAVSVASWEPKSRATAAVGNVNICG